MKFLRSSFALVPVLHSSGVFAFLIVVAHLLTAATSTEAAVAKIFQDTNPFFYWSTRINDFYNVSGHTSSIHSSAITSDSLVGVDLLIGWERRTAYSNSEITAMSDFLNGGGRIAFYGEHDSFDSENNNINAALTGLGSSMQIGTAGDNLFDLGWQTATGSQITGHFLNSGVTSFRYAAPNDLVNVSGGGAIFLAQDLTTVFAAFDGLAGNGIVVMTDSNVTNFSGSYGNDQWHLNLLTATNPIPEPTSLAIWSAIALGGLGLAHRRRKRTA